ncbi:MAG: 5'/3'-nucleotidase SurE [Microthrixaceae bacterium]
MIAMGAAACSGSDDTASGSTSSTATSTSTSAPTTNPPKKLTILVSNDDGYSAPGIDALVQALVALPDTEVVVSAPATQQSGKGSAVTDGDVTATDEKTTSGYPAHAVAGTPADSVNWALNGGIDVKPDLVLTGINQGQNLGEIGNRVSGTLGAARAAVAHGIPALASSMGIQATGDRDTADYALAATYVVEWVKEHRADILEGKLAGDSPLLENMNIPSCNSGGELRGVVEVTMAATAEGALNADQNCKSTTPAAPDDITSFNNGFVTVSEAAALPPAA